MAKVKYFWTQKELQELPIKALCDKYKCNRSTVYYSLRKNHIVKDKYVFTDEHKKKIKENHADISGVRNPNYRDGRTLLKHRCIECDTEVSSPGVRCYSCHNSYHQKRRQKSKEYLANSLKGLFKRCLCVGKSKIFFEFLDLMHPGEFKYVGDGTLVIDRYTPDFYNGKDKLIEFFGDYWHTKSPNKDAQKLETYTKEGYKCLVVWEKELEDLKALKNKLNSYVNS